MAASLSRSAWGFDPRSIPRCMSWIDAADTSTLTTSGNNVTVIRDKANYVNYNVTGTGGITTGLLSLNGNNLLNITNDCSAIFASNVTYSNANRTVFFVAQVDSASVPGVTPRTYQFITGPTSGASIALYYWHGSAAIIGGRSGLNAAVVASNDIPAGFFNSSFILSFTNRPNQIRLNGSLLTLSTNTTFTMTTGALGQTLGGSVASRQAWRLGELLLYDDVLNTSNRQIIEGYLAAKWGLTANLPSDHPYKTTRFFGRELSPILDTNGCILWLDAADTKTITISSGNNVSQWLDKSPFSNHATQATSANQPVLVSNVRNGLPVIRFSGLGGVNRTDTRFLENATLFFPSPPYTVFAVAQAVSNAASSAYGYNYIFKPSRTTDWYYMMGSLNNAFTTFTGSATAWNDTAALAGGVQPTSNWTVFTVANSGNRIFPYISGNARTGKVGTSVAGAIGYTVGDAAVGFRGQNWNGDIAEILVFNQDVSYTERYMIEGYLAWKWGITADLPAAHSYKNTRLNPQGNSAISAFKPFTFYDTSTTRLYSGISMSYDGTTAVAAEVLLPSVYVTTDGGLTWTARNTGLPTTPTIEGYAIAKASPSTMYVSFGSNGIWKSTNTGVSWTNVAPSTSSYTYLACSSNGQTVVAQASASVLNTFTGTIISTNGGTSWTQASQTQLRTGTARGVAVSGDGTIIFATMGSTVSPNTGAVYRSTNSGSTWTSVFAARLYEGIECSADAQVVLVGTSVTSGSTTPFLSTDGGSSWNAPTGVPSGFTEWKVQAVSSNGNTLLVSRGPGSGTNRNFFSLSVDRGVSWSDVYPNMSNSTTRYFLGATMNSTGDRILLTSWNTSTGPIHSALIGIRYP